MALTLSHERLAEEQRRNEELRARVRDAGDARRGARGGDRRSASCPRYGSAFPRSRRKCCRTTRSLLAAALPDGGKARVYASSAPAPSRFPDVVEVPPAVASESRLGIRPRRRSSDPADQQHLEATQRGYRSALRVPLRLDGEPVAAFAFLSFTPAKYSAGRCARSARHIGDRLLQSFARERRSALRKQRRRSVGARVAARSARARS